jgi:pimeloyl-ACP methyl ester carboxylesterase
MSEPQMPARWQMDLSDVTAFDPVTAAVAGWISYYAYYEDAPQWWQALGPANHIQRLPPDLATGRPLGWAFRLPECNVVVFSGTTEYSTLWRYLGAATVSPLSVAPGSAHVGTTWARWCRNLDADFHAVFDALIAEDKTIFCGHSAGGAFAAAMQAYLIETRGPLAHPTVSYVFGCPRVGAGAFANLNRAAFNIVNPFDPVTKLPWVGLTTFPTGSDSLPRFGSSPAFFWQRHGRVLYVDPQGFFIEQQTAGFDNSRADAGVFWDARRLASNALGSDFPFNIKTGRAALAEFNNFLGEHLMRGYLDRVIANAEPSFSGSGGDWSADADKLEQTLTKDPVDVVRPMVTIPITGGPPLPPSPPPLRFRRRH